MRIQEFSPFISTGQTNDGNEILLLIQLAHNAYTIHNEGL